MSGRSLHNNISTADRCHSEPPRDQFPPLTIPTMLCIETHQPWARFVINQSLTTTALQIIRLSKSTLSPDEYLQYAIETSRSISVVYLVSWGGLFLEWRQLHWHHSKISRPQLTSSDTTQHFIANYFIHLKEYIIVDKK